MHFEKTYLLNHVHFRWTAGIHLLWFTCMYKWKVHCSCGPNKLLPAVFCSPRQPRILRSNQCAVEFLNQFAYAWLPWTSVPNQPANVATISDSPSGFRCPTLCCLLLLTIISHTLGLLTSLGFTHLILCGIHGRRETDPRASNGASEIEDIYRC